MKPATYFLALLPLWLLSCAPRASYTLLQLQPEGFSLMAPRDHLYGVQVYLQSEQGLKPFAYGVFDHLDSLKLRLPKGAKAHLHASMLSDGKRRLIAHPQGWGRPFLALPWGQKDGGEPQPVHNHFVYSDTHSLEGLFMGWAEHRYQDADGSWKEASAGMFRPFLDRYFGSYQLQQARPKQLAIPLYRAAFGLHIQTKGLTDGRLLVRTAWSPELQLDARHPEVRQVLSMDRLEGACTPQLQGAAGRNAFAQEKIHLSAVWERPDGRVIVLEPQPFFLTRGREKTLLLELSEEQIRLHEQSQEQEM